MFEIIFYPVLFFGIPLAILAFWGVSICRYAWAKKRNKREPGSIAPHELSHRKTQLVVASVVTGVLLAVVIAFVVLLYLAIAYM